MAEIVKKVNGFFHEVKDHWKTPPEGKYVPYREYKDIFLTPQEAREYLNHLMASEM